MGDRDADVVRLEITWPVPATFDKGQRESLEAEVVNAVVRRVTGMLHGARVTQIDGSGVSDDG